MEQAVPTVAKMKFPFFLRFELIDSPDAIELGVQFKNITVLFFFFPGGCLVTRISINDHKKIAVVQPHILSAFSPV